MEACQLRLRPILMTDVTTVLDLYPLALDPGTEASMPAAPSRTVIGDVSVHETVAIIAEYLTRRPGRPPSAESSLQPVG